MSNPSPERVIAQMQAEQAKRLKQVTNRARRQRSQQRTVGTLPPAAKRTKQRKAGTLPPHRENNTCIRTVSG